MEQPGSRHSYPASSSTWSSPSASAIFFTSPEPGTTRARTPAATWRPLLTCATARTSSILPFVQEPMKTVSTSISLTLIPPCRPMYSRARFKASCLPGSASWEGSGTSPSIGATSSGDVPHVTWGTIWLTSKWISLSYVAPVSEGKVFQYATAFSHSSPFGLIGLSFKYLNVVSSGAIMPARAPASIDMLQIVILASMLRALIAGPAYSIT
mmetsp:Transcript_47854/g.93981  ORF Transcript_47854/g.93981 Transcript_47854/m.93981 type:complete len:211 (+) Transcript_47854:1056-1688(+)